jgi:hypothetical protein
MNENQVLNFKLRSCHNYFYGDYVKAVNKNINMEVILKSKDKLLIKNLKNGKNKEYSKIPKQYQALYDSMQVYGALVKPEDEEKEKLDFSLHKLDILGLDIGAGQSFTRFTTPHIPTFEPCFQFNSEPAYKLELLKSRKHGSRMSLPDIFGYSDFFGNPKRIMSLEEEADYYKTFEMKVIQKIKDKEKLCDFDFYPNKYNMIEKRLDINKMLNIKIKRELEKEVK